MHIFHSGGLSSERISNQDRTRFLYGLDQRGAHFPVRFTGFTGWPWWRIPATAGSPSRRYHPRKGMEGPRVIMTHYHWIIHPSKLSEKSIFSKSQVLSLSHNQLRCLRPLSVLVSLSEVGIGWCTWKNGSLEDHVFCFLRWHKIFHVFFVWWRCWSAKC